MRRLPSPNFDAWTLTALAASKFAGTPFEQQVLGAEPALKDAYSRFEAANQTSSWHTLSACLYGQGGQMIVAGLTKDQLRSLYSDGVVKGDTSARDVYDQIKVSAEGKCPYCGGIGDVDPLDHYLPKARYPQFSVMPTNLIPSCDKCNKLSGSSVVSEYQAQTLNPYFDHERFFAEPWIFVEFIDDDIMRYAYVCEPPAHWNDGDKARARKHFDDFLLAERYAATASSDVSYLANDFPRIMAGVNDPTIIQDYLLSKANCESYVVNGWQRPLYRALSGAAWYLALF